MSRRFAKIAAAFGAVVFTLAVLRVWKQLD
jgi:hypothetical protein